MAFSNYPIKPEDLRGARNVAARQYACRPRHSTTNATQKVQEIPYLTKHSLVRLHET